MIFFPPTFKNMICGVWHNYQISSNELLRCRVICSKATFLCILFQSQCLSVLLGGNIL